MSKITNIMRFFRNSEIDFNVSLNLPFLTLGANVKPPDYKAEIEERQKTIKDIVTDAKVSDRKNAEELLNKLCLEISSLIKTLKKYGKLEEGGNLIINNMIALTAVKCFLEFTDEEEKKEDPFRESDEECLAKLIINSLEEGTLDRDRLLTLSEDFREWFDSVNSIGIVLDDFAGNIDNEEKEIDMLSKFINLIEETTKYNYFVNKFLDKLYEAK